MTPTEYRAALARLSLSQVGAARLLGTTPRQSRRWAAGDAIVPVATAMLLRLAVTMPINLVEMEWAKEHPIE